jgi:molybdate transport system ATP-binding protein
MSRLRFRCRHRFVPGFELDAQFEVDGGVTALFGPSGAGKSTCLGIISGIIRPQAGQVTLGETVLLDVAENIFRRPEKRDVGVIFQEHRLFPHLAVADNLRFGQRRQKKVPIDFGKLVEVLELGEFLNRYPRQLSGGQQQRVALGRAILRGPSLLLMDEPLAALDESLKERILVFLERALAQWKIPTLFVSHDQADVRRLAQCVVVLEAGKVVDAGPTIATLDAAVTTKMQSPPGPLNLVRVNDVRQVEGHWEGRIGEHPIRLPTGVAAANTPVYVQFLPSDVTLSRTYVEGVSIRNQWPGRVRELVSLADRMFVAIDVGVLLWAEITIDSARDLGLAVDAPVMCLIKTAAVKLIG